MVEKNEYFHFLITNYHIIPENIIKEKKEIYIFYGDSKKESQRKIDLDKNKRYIKCNDNYDSTIIQILNEDNISDEKYLYPDSNYKKGCQFYLNKHCYLAGYPVIDKDMESLIGEPLINKKPERCISQGKITNINKVYNYDFEHYLETRTGSSGSPICLKRNLQVIGIHKGKNKIYPKNNATFIGAIIEEINNDNIIKEIKSIKEHDEEKFKDKIYISEKEEDLSEENEDIFLYKISEEEFDFQRKITFLILFISFTNLKFIWSSKLNGKGKMYYPDKRYEGEFKINDSIKKGFGIIYYKNGDIYEGGFKNNMYDGIGVYYFKNGDRYKGEFKDGMCNGIGTYYFYNGGRYEGLFKNGIYDGCGTFYSSLGFKYEGYFKESSSLRFLIIIYKILLFLKKIFLMPIKNKMTLFLIIILIIGILITY